MSAVDPAVQPVEIDLDRGSELRIRWADGLESVYPLAVLRRECPCAVCRQEREEKAGNPLRVMKSREEQQAMVTAAGAELVGHYALRIRWQDGHAAGVYEFALLRSLSCPSRQAGGP